MKDPASEKKELVHEPVPGYRAVFYIVIAIAVLYLSWIFMVSI